MSNTWANYGTYGANWSEFQREKDPQPVIDNILNNPVTEVLDAIPPGESTGNPTADRLLNGFQLIKEGWNQIKKRCQ
ncbi:MAG: hypothetical protein M1510_10555 [Nitrospirae bacterium]|nr:hypothetical protein [Nitrospirota bacterium]